MIEINSISKKIGDKQLFQNFTARIDDAAFVVITGESGSGKTTLLNMIGGIDDVDSGEILINGKSLTSFSRIDLYRNEIGFLFQNFALIEKKTVEENLNLVMRKNRTNISISEALKRVGLSGVEKKKVYQLSGGEQQRIALARLMIKKCNIILADEPTGSLDSRNSNIVMEQLHMLNKEEKTIIMVTHNLQLLQEATMSITL
ncbi:MAG: ATP-binding cassette domain-containing protein [Lachnospiraceae bacterium]|nr:ATP-binding cassette domain-containing protein [Lachnospiraceae bacterium]